MTISEIKLPLNIIHQLLEQAQSSTETEVCGLLGGLKGKAHSCYPIRNSHSTPHSKFTLEPSEQITAFKSLREKKEQLFAIYHSHPNSEAYPSVTDVAQSEYPETLYLIISLKTKGVLEMRGFYLVDQQIKEVSIQIDS
jgi:proteasome lid subunit RPN8/RPN11